MAAWVNTAAAPQVLVADKADQVQVAEQTTETTSVKATSKQPASKTSASLVLAKVQAFYDGVGDIHANFRQSYANPLYGTHTVRKGNVQLKKPGMMYWDYEGAGDADFYADGRKLCVVEHDTRQVVSQDISNNASLTGAMKFLFGGEQLTQDFLVRMAGEKLISRYGMDGHWIIEMKPKKSNENYKKLLLVVSEKTGQVDAFVVLNQDDSTNHFELSDIRLNSGIKDEQFSCTVPKGYIETQG